MKKFYTCFFISSLFFLSPFYLISQTVANYVFSPSSSVFNQLSGATAITLTGGVDEGYMNNVPIGFTFYYNSVPYTTLAISTNGFVSLGQNLSALNGFVNNLATGSSTSVQRPILAPLWDDLSTFNPIDISYMLSGTAPNRIFTVQWLNCRWAYNAGAPGISFQLKLSEANSKIEYIYRPEAGTLLSPSASIGITNVATGVKNFLSITSTSNNPYDTSTMVETTTLNTKPALGQSYAFVPKFILPIAPALPTFSSITGTTMVINWIDNTSSETYYQIYVSGDNINFNLYATTYSTSILTTGTNYQQAITGLLPGNTYYFRIFACNEGSASSNYVTATQATASGLLSGVKTICPSGCDYTSIGVATNDVRSKGISGSLILELDSTYNPNVETYPLNFGNLLTNGPNNVILRPRANVRNTIHFISVASPTFDLNTTDYLTIDGKVGGVGPETYIHISNFSSSGTAIRFLNDACNNTITDCRISGASSSTTSGVITFSNTNGTQGNSNNSIYYCTIKDSIANPIYAIYSSGNSSYPNLYNTIYGNHIYDYYNGSNASYGIYLTTGTNAWFIGSNHFFQTASRNLSFNNAGAIFANSGAAYTIYGNYIGGSLPSCGGNASAYDGSGTLSMISMNLPSNNTCIIQENYIQNLNLNLSGASNSLINMVNGSFFVMGNTMGDLNSNHNIRFNSGASNILFSGILLNGGSSYGTINIASNSLAGITVGGIGTVQFKGIHIVNAVPELFITGNSIGSAGTPNSIIDSTAQVLFGISGPAGNSPGTISGNVVMNLSAPNTSVNTRICGIYVNSAGTYTLSGNNVGNLSTGSASINTGTAASVIGILHNATGLDQVCSGNTVSGLYSTSTTGAIAISGIHYAGSISGSNEMAGNYVHGLNSVSTGSSIINGIYNGSSAVNCYNNRVRLGLDMAGASQDRNHFIAGINDAGNSNSYAHNSVYIGGNAVVTGTNNSCAFYNSVGSSGTRNILNNIFFNARSNASGTGKHYAIFLTSTALTGLLMNHNIYFTTGFGGFIGRFNGTDYSTFNLWRSITFSDYNSGLGNPNFVAPNGSAATLNLRVQSPTPAEGSGIAISTIPNDFEEDPRSSNTPVDIGADAGNYTGVDIFSPSINYTPLTNTPLTTNRILNVGISDFGTGVRNSASLQPRIWYRRSFPTLSAWVSTAGVLVSGNGQNGNWNFTIDYSLIGAPVVVGNQFQYYIVAQDSAAPTNLFYNPFAGANHASVSTQNTAPNNPSNYNIVNNLPVIINVGNGQTYTTLTGATGLFAAINAGALASNTVVNIVSDIIEPGTVSLSNAGLAGYNLLIQPDNNPRVLSGSLVPGWQGLISLNGARGVTIDGGPLRNLTIRNVVGTSPANVSAAIYINNGTNDTIRNCVLESNSNNSGIGIVLLGTSSAGTPSSGLMIKNNLIRPPGNINTNSPNTGIIINSAAGNLSNSSICGNQLSDFNNYGIYLANAGSNITIGDSVNSANGNALFQTSPRALHYYMLIGSGNGHVIAKNSFYNAAGNVHTGNAYCIYAYNNINNILITGNYLGGAASNRSGQAFRSSASVLGIYLAGGSLGTSVISNNFLSNFALSGSTNFTGIYSASGNVNINNNTIGGAGSSNNAYDTLAISQDFYGIRYTGASNLNLSGNIISNIKNYGPGITTCMSVEAGISNINTNSIYDIITFATTYNNADYSCTGIRMSAASAGNLIENNLIYNLNNNSTVNSAAVTGIAIMGSLNSSNIQRNRIYRLNASGTNTAGNSPVIRGIYIGAAGSSIYANNQITLTPAVPGTQPRVRGIELNTTGGSNTFYFNSIYLGGVAAGANSSSAFLRNTSTSTAALELKNNILFNERSGAGSHYALSANLNVNFVHDYNLFVCNTLSAAIEYPLGTNRSLPIWNTFSGNPINNLINTAVQLPSSQFFPNSSNGDLGTNACRVSNMGGYVTLFNDFANNNRNYPPDLGSVEFGIASGAPAISSHPLPVSITCGPSNALFSIRADGYNLSYQWEENRGSGWNNLINSSTYSGVNTDTLRIISPSGSMNTYQYRCTVSGACTPASSSNATTLSISNTSSWTGSVSNAWGNAANWSCGVVPLATTDVLISNVSNLPVISDSARYCNNLTIGTAASLTLNNALSSLSVSGIIALNGNLINTNGQIIFSGNAAQIMPGIAYNNLRINNPSGTTLSGNVTLNGQLVFSNGNIVLDKYDFNLVGTSSGISGASSASKFFVSNDTGTLNIQNIGSGGRTGAVLFPVGSGMNSYQPLTLSNTGTLDEFRVRVFNKVYNNYTINGTPIGPNYSSNMVDKTWILNEGIAGGSNVNLTLQWNVGDELVGFNRNNCHVARYDLVKWYPNTTAAASGVNPYTRSLSGVNSFMAFGVAGAGALPVELLQWNASKSEADVILDWSTATEINSHFFEIERSIDGQTFNAIGKLAAATNSHTVRHYQYTDVNIFSVNQSIQKFYYRLKMVDLDGTLSYTPVIAVQNEEKDLNQLQVFPNPYSNELYIQLVAPNEESIQIELMDITGKMVYHKTQIMYKGHNRFLLNQVEELPSGMYFLSIGNSDNKQIIKLVKK